MSAVPSIERDWALFLDLDGTLLDLAPTPAKVCSPEYLAGTLEGVRGVIGGALAVVSGRMLEEVDRLLSPLKLPGAGEHGAVVRYPSGAIDRNVDLQPIPEDWLRDLHRQTLDKEGLIVERKAYSVAIHFRLAPHRAEEVHDLALSLVRRAHSRFELLAAKMAFEIRSKGVTKARAVRLLMRAEPFRGRVPVFVGDDVTDNDGMAAAREFGGFGLHVDPIFGGKPSAVRDWLRRAADTLR